MTKKSKSMTMAVINALDLEAIAEIQDRTRKEVYEEAGEKWGDYAARLIGEGVDDDLVEDICFDGYMGIRYLGLCMALEREFTGFKLPWSGRTLTQAEIHRLAIGCTKPPEDPLQSYVEAKATFRTAVLLRQQIDLQG